MHPLHKLMAKKKQEGKKLSPMEKKGKEESLSSLIDDMMGMDGDKVKGLKKVTVASDSPKGLSKGLQEAKELIGDAPTGGLEDEEMPEGEKLAEAEDEMPEGEEADMEMAEAEDEEEMSKEELLAEIDRLKAELEKAKA